MWCNKHAQQVSTDTLNARPKLRPIMPRPFPNTFFTTPTPCCYPQNNIKITPWNHLLSGYGGKRETISTVPFVSSRWNPTREQLQALEEMYRNGIRTPSAQQIQQIAAKLRRFGKIEGKNVFYWFQNHKARERQKKRRQMELNTRDVDRPEKRQSGLSRTYLETKHPRKLPTPSSCSTASEYSASMQGAVVQECKQEKWAQTDCKELQEQNLTAKRIETWWPLDLSFCMPLSSNNKVTDQNQENEKPFVAAIFENNKLLAAPNNNNKINKTLQLFPVGTGDSSVVKADYTEGEEDYDVSTVGPALAPTNKFFEFLPTKY